MANVVVIGAGIAGLVSAIACARRGHQVTLFEKDERPQAATCDEVMSSWNRPGTPQGLLPHAFVSLGRNLLRDRATDLLEALRDAGARERNACRSLPPRDRARGDDDLWVLFCRRPVFEWVLWQAAASERNIEIVPGATVNRLVVLREDGRPRVRSVGARVGGMRAADLVIDASGRRSRVWSLLREAGVDVDDEETTECGLVYYARFYMRMPGTREPDGPWVFGPRVELPYGMAMVHLADTHTFSVTFAAPTWDPELRVLRRARAFTAALGSLPGMRAWIDDDVAIPISDVLGMGGLRNVLRPFARDGEANVLGLLPVGDTLCHTNAAYGWGAALGIAQAFAAVDALDAHGDDARAIARDYHARMWPVAEGRYRAAVEMDALRKRAWTDASDPAALADLPYATRVRELLAALPKSARVLRPLMRSMLMLDTPDVLLGDDATLRAARAAVAEDETPAPKVPSRQELLRTIWRALE